MGSYLRFLRDISLGPLTLLETHPDSCSELRVVNLDVSHATSATDTGSSAHNLTANQFVAHDFSWLDYDAMGVIIILDGRYESLYFVDLLFGTVTKTDDIDCYCIFL